MSSTNRSDQELAETAAALRHASTRFFRLMRRQAETGMTPSQLAAMSTIDAHGPLPIGQLAELEGVAAPTATKIVDQLCSSGYVRRKSDPDDRRVRLLAVTDDGRAFLARVRDRRTAWLVQQLAEFSDEEFEQVHRTVDLLQGLVAAHAEDPSSLKN